MDFLLSVLAIGGLVFAGVMLVLASRASRMQRESAARVQRLQTMAVGSVLFADEEVDDWAGATELRAADATVFPDDAPEPAPSRISDVATEAYPFVMTVPAGAGRVPGSFDRNQRRSRT